MKRTIGFFGLGLIGGSIAKAIKKIHPFDTILAFDIQVESLESGKNEGILDTYYTEITEEFSKCDYLFLCAPVKENILFLKYIKPFLDDHTILTDVSSVKTGIHEEIKTLGLESSFIGGHPMAGSERYGYLNSKASLLENAYYIITPCPNVEPKKLDDFVNFISSLKAIPLVMNPSMHDFATAAVSHLPHVLAYALVTLVQKQDDSDEVMKTIAAGGFKDITRIASSSPVMWQQICMENKTNLLFLLDEYIDSLKLIKDKITKNLDRELSDYFKNARDYRESFLEVSAGPIKKVFSLHINIPDRSGTLASIANELAKESINIKNIGIVHNREFQEGVLRIEFYDDTSLFKASTILKESGYQIVQ